MKTFYILSILLCLLLKFVEAEGKKNPSQKERLISQVEIFVAHRIGDTLPNIPSLFLSYEYDKNCVISQVMRSFGDGRPTVITFERRRDSLISIKNGKDKISYPLDNNGYVIDKRDAFIYRKRNLIYKRDKHSKYKYNNHPNKGNLDLNSIVRADFKNIFYAPGYYWGKKKNLIRTYYYKGHLGCVIRKRPNYKSKFVYDYIFDSEGYVVEIKEYCLYTKYKSKHYRVREKVNKLNKIYKISYI